MSWNYRICKDGGYYSIRECYYTGNKMDGWTENPCYPCGESLKVLRDDFAMMQEAFRKPMVNLDKKQSR